MSLISDALKKAQALQQAKDTTSQPPPLSRQAAMPGPLPGPAAPIPAAQHGPRWPVVIGLLSGITLVLALCSAVIVWAILRSDSRRETNLAEAPTSTVSAHSTEASTSQASPAAQPSALASANPLPPIVFQMDDESTEALSPVPAPSLDDLPDDALSLADSPVFSLREEIAPPAAPTPDPDPQVAAYIAQLEVRGIMTGGAKVLLFDPAESRSRAYSAGDRVNDEMGLTIHEITSRNIAFVDHAGALYSKRF